MIRIALSDRQAEGLEAVFRGTADRRLRDRAQVVLMSHRGRPREQVAADLGVTTRTVQRWLNAFREKGTDGLRPRKAPGPAARIPGHLAGELRRWVIAGPAACGLDRANWTYEDLAAHLGREHGVRVGRSAMHEFCRRHGIRPYRPTYRFLRGDPAKQERAGAELAALKRGRREAGSSC